jgi:hypothetical protein
MVFKGKPSIPPSRELYTERMKNVYGYFCSEHGSITTLQAGCEDNILTVVF